MARFKILVDADSIVYKASLQAQHSEKGVVKVVAPMSTALSVAKHFMDKINRRFKEQENTVLKNYLTKANDTSNFRIKIADYYKANRKGKEKPIHYQAVRNYLITNYDVKVVTGQEADDRLGIEWAKQPLNCALVHEDKDLNQFYGQHYNPFTDTLYMVSEEDAIRSFYLQLLTGDTIDNIPGLPKVGPVTAKRVLNGLTDEKDLFNAVYKTYKDKGKTEEYLLEQGRLLWIRRRPKELWTFPC